MKKYVWRFFQNENRLSVDFIVVGSLFQMLGAGAEEVLVKLN